MKVTFKGVEAQVQLSVGGKSMVVNRDEPIEIPDDWSTRVLSNPNFVKTEPEEKPAEDNQEK